METKQIHNPRLRFAMAPVANPKSFCLDIKKTGEVEDCFDVHFGPWLKTKKTENQRYHIQSIARCYD